VRTPSADKLSELNQQFPDAELTWGPPPNLIALIRDAQRKRFVALMRVLVMTFLIAYPTTVFVIKFYALPIAIGKWSAIVIGIFLWMPILAGMMKLKSLALRRSVANPPECPADLYGLSVVGVRVPQMRPGDPSCLEWNNFGKWWIKRPACLPSHRIIVFNMKGRRKGIWLPGTSDDVAILAAFEKYSPQRLAALRASR
jgi:hypothetical protein